MELISHLITADVMARKYHWATKLFSAHMALGEFYDSITELTDSFVEKYQGCYGLIETFECLKSDEKNPIIYFEGCVKEIELKRYEWVDEKNTALHNIIDEIVGEYYELIYKLKFLR